MNFSEIIILADIDNYSIDFYQSSLTNDYDMVKKEYCLKYARIALEHYNIMLQYENISGFFIVDWRINFSNLFDYMEKNNLPIEQNTIITEFINVYKNNSAKLLYQRLGI